MEPTDLTIELLKSIREEIRKTNCRLESLERGQAEINEQLNRHEQVLIRMVEARLSALEARLAP